MEGRKKNQIRITLENANQLSIQLCVIQQLQKGPLLDSELRELIENLDGDYELLLPILKKSGLVRSERLGEGYRGNRFKYYATMLEKADNNNGHGDKPLYTFKVTYQGSKKGD